MVVLSSVMRLEVNAERLFRGLNIGTRICTERKTKNLPQIDLERRCGLARCRIYWLEQGRAIPTIETLGRIADALEIPPFRLLLDADYGCEAVMIPRKRGDGRKAYVPDEQY
jgi:transcriptional regulator with XRE-family HTH domain